MAKRGSKIDVVALVPDRDAIRAWFADTDPTEREASTADARERFWDLSEDAFAQRQVTDVIALLNEWGGWLPLTASRCQSVKAVRHSRA